MISAFRSSDFQISGSAISSRKNNHKIKMLLELGVPVAGVKLVNNKLAVCDGIEIADSDMEQGAV